MLPQSTTAKFNMIFLILNFWRAKKVGGGAKVCKVNQYATIHLYTRYLACLHQNLCLCPALLLQMDLKLHLKITKIYKISNNDINVLQSSRTLKLTELRWVKKWFQGRGWWVFPYFSPPLLLVCPSSLSFSIAFKMAAAITAHLSFH